jgi:hypothetical protein
MAYGKYANNETTDEYHSKDGYDAPVELSF